MFIAIVEVTHWIRSQMLIWALVALWRFMARIALVALLVFVIFVCQTQVCPVLVKVIIQVSKGLEGWLSHLTTSPGRAVL